MWNDEKDNMLDVLDELEKKLIEFPSICPVCGKSLLAIISGLFFHHFGIL